jgi:diguanylate cyclase (GGDEF)-like protein
VQPAPFAPDETGRLIALRDLKLVDTPPERRFDRVAQLAARLTGSPIGIVSLVEETRIFFKSVTGATATGVDLGSPHREYWFCSHVVATGQPLVVRDARTDDRFDRLALACGDPPVVAYAGVPLRSPSGQHVGALAVLDVEPHTYVGAEVRALAELARLIEAELSSLPHLAIDALTGALNARTFTRLGDRFLDLAESRGIPACLMRLQVRELGDVRARFGLEAGDSALTEAAQLIGSTVRGSDLVGRVAPDAFGVLLFGSDGAAAKLVVSRLQDATAQHNASAERRYPFRLSFDIGFSERRHGDEADIATRLVTAAMMADLRL